jgi:hypothetical protein
MFERSMAEASQRIAHSLNVVCGNTCYMPHAVEASTTCKILIFDIAHPTEECLSRFI